MNRIDKLPDLDWTEQARREIELTGQVLLDQTDYAWVIGKVAVCGIIYRTFTGSPWFWFALAKGITIRDLIDFRRLAARIPYGTLTAVQEDFTEGKRFAKLYGFEATDTVYENESVAYRIYRRI